MLSNMRGQASNTVQQGKQWIGHQAQQVKQFNESYIRKEINYLHNLELRLQAVVFKQVKVLHLKKRAKVFNVPFSSNHQVTHTPKSMYKSEGKHVNSSQSHGSILFIIKKTLTLQRLNMVTIMNADL